LQLACMANTIWISAMTNHLCSFSVVIFSHNLKNVGDIRQLAGKSG